MTTIDNITNLAQAIASDQEALDSAHKAEKEANKTAIQAILKAALPAFRSLAGRPKIASSTSNDCLRGGPDHKEFADWSGIRICGDGLEEDGKRDDLDGSYAGWAVYWRNDGTFAMLKYSGNWSRWQGARCSWRADVATIDLDTVAKRLRAEELAVELEKAMRELAEKKSLSSSAKDKLTRADKLKAIAALL